MMNIAVFGATPDEWQSLNAALAAPDFVLRAFTGAPTPEWAAAPENADTDALCVFVHDRVTAAVIDALPQLKLVATRSTGFDHVDLDAAARADVAVCNVPTYGENTVAEFTFALLLSLSRRLHTAYVRGREGDFSLDGLQGFDLRGKTLGIIGTGHIGLHVARIARGFGMQVIASDPAPQTFFAELVGFTYTDTDDLLAQADVVTLHVPLLEATHHLINADTLRRMKPGAVLLNTGRGGLVDTTALLEALDSGHLAGAGLDVLEGEERLAEIGPALMQGRPNLIVTAHMAFDSREAVGRILDTTADNIRAFAAGRPQNVVRR